MLNFGCQPYSLYREDFLCSSLKLFGSIRIAYGFYSQTLAGYNKKVTLISQGYKPFKFENAGFLLPLNRCGGFSANIIHNTGNAVHFVNDTVGDFTE